jgi:hypothetical protein
MGAYPGGDSVKLLRAINAYQAHGRVDSSVLPCAIASAAGLEPSTERYEEAVWRLLVEGALEVDGSVPPDVVARWSFGRAPYRLAPAAIRMLEKA